jgi:hypothetical protein
VIALSAQGALERRLRRVVDESAGGQKERGVWGVHTISPRAYPSRPCFHVSYPTSMVGDPQFSLTTTQRPGPRLTLNHLVTERKRSVALGSSQRVLVYAEFNMIEFGGGCRNFYIPHIYYDLRQICVGLTLRERPGLNRSTLQLA